MKKRPNPSDDTSVIWLGIAAAVAAIWYSVQFKRAVASSVPAVEPPKDAVRSGTGLLLIFDDPPVREVDWWIVSDGTGYSWVVRLRPGEPTWNIGYKEREAKAGKTFLTPDAAFADLVKPTAHVTGLVVT